jgi:hypothetical protein
MLHSVWLGNQARALEKVLQIICPFQHMCGWITPEFEKVLQTVKPILHTVWLDNHALA